MRALVGLLIALGGCSSTEGGHATDGPARHDTQTPDGEAGQKDAGPDGERHDAQTDVLLQADAQHDAQTDTTPQQDSQRDSQTDMLIDTSPGPDAACGIVGQTCCEGSQCQHWPALDHSYMCVNPGPVCVECGTANRPCCNYTPRCASWLQCIYVSSVDAYRCK